MEVAHGPELEKSRADRLSGGIAVTGPSCFLCASCGCLFFALLLLNSSSKIKLLEFCHFLLSCPQSKDQRQGNR